MITIISESEYNRLKPMQDRLFFLLHEKEMNRLKDKNNMVVEE